MCFTGLFFATRYGITNISSCHAQIGERKLSWCGNGMLLYGAEAFCHREQDHWYSAVDAGHLLATHYGLQDLGEKLYRWCQTSLNGWKGHHRYSFYPAISVYGGYLL